MVQLRTERPLCARCSTGPCKVRHKAVHKKLIIHCVRYDLGKTYLSRKQQYVSCLKRKGKTSHVLKGLGGGGSRADWRNQVRLLENHDTLGPRTRGGRDRQRRGPCGQRLFQVRETMHLRQASVRVQGLLFCSGWPACLLWTVQCECVCV